MIPTKLQVFNTESSLQFDVNTPQFLKEVCECSEKGVYAICYNIFRSLLAMVAERATELNDPILNVLMIRLNLYEIPPQERNKVINKIKTMIDNEEVSKT